MANISITRRCRRQCRYCFAKHELARSPVLDMPFEVFDRAIAFLKRSGIPEARLLGGEPTEHPVFCDLVTRAREADLKVAVFSGGLIPDVALEYLAALPAKNLLLVLNTGDPASDSPELLRRQHQVCQILGKKVMLGINIRSFGQDPRYLVEWINRYNLRRNIRMGIAHPIWGGSNEWFRLRHPRQIPIFETFFAMLQGEGVHVGFDCGFTPCMFSEAFVRSHADMFKKPRMSPPQTQAIKTGPTGPRPKKALNPLGGQCGPVIDILPEGTCIACYALSRVCRLPLPDEGTRDDLVSAFEKNLSFLTSSGMHRDCVTCPYRAPGMCEGGCRARQALRFRPGPPVPASANAPNETVTGVP